MEVILESKNKFKKISICCNYYCHNMASRMLDGIRNRINIW